MYHPFRKDSSYLGSAIFGSYHEKCSYCGRTIQARDMHVDHIIPTNTAFEQLLEILDESKISESWSKSYTYPYKKKNVKNRYEKLMDLLDLHVG